MTGIVTNLKFGNRNAGFMETEGYDLDVSYRLDTRFGKFNVNSATTYVSSATYRTSNDSSIVPIVTNGIGSAFRVRSNLALGYDLGDFGVTWTARYYSGVKETCSNIGLYPDECSDPGVYAPWYKGSRNYNERGSVTFHDVQFRYNLPWDATVAVGANNVFEKSGPIMYLSLIHI